MPLFAPDGTGKPLEMIVGSSISTSGQLLMAGQPYEHGSLPAAGQDHEHSWHLGKLKNLMSRAACDFFGPETYLFQGLWLAK